MVVPNTQSNGKGLSRRTLLEWLGTGAVLALGGDFVATCTALAQESSPGFAFAPGEGNDEIFTDWWERTIDRQDLASLIANWQFEVGGLVENPFTLSFAELAAWPSTKQSTDFHCVEGWSVLDVPWVGVRLSEVVERAKPKAEAKFINFRTVGDKYNESLPLSVAREPKTLLAYGVGETTLPLAHGFPLRVVIPRLLGYKNAKYVYRIELDATAIEGFWVKAGYDITGTVPEERLRPGK